MMNPIGPNWNTMETFHKQIKPEVEVKRGHVIQPLGAKWAKTYLNSASSGKDGQKKVKAFKREANKRRPESVVKD